MLQKFGLFQLSPFVMEVSKEQFLIVTAKFRKP